MCCLLCGGARVSVNLFSSSIFETSAHMIHDTVVDFSLGCKVACIHLVIRFLSPVKLLMFGVRCSILILVSFDADA